MFLIRLIVALITASTLLISTNAMAGTETHKEQTKAVSSVQNTVTEKVNLNTATVEQLRKIKGIGPAKAEAIVDYRTKQGPFKSVDDLSSVKGFSSKTVASLVSKNPDVMVVE